MRRTLCHVVSPKKTKQAIFGVLAAPCFATTAQGNKCYATLNNVGALGTHGKMKTYAAYRPFDFHHLAPHSVIKVHRLQLVSATSCGFYPVAVQGLSRQYLCSRSLFQPVFSLEQVATFCFLYYKPLACVVKACGCLYKPTRLRLLVPIVVHTRLL